LGLGYEEGRELPHQSANCVPIYEEDFLIQIYLIHYYPITHINTIFNTTTATTGTTSTTATVTASSDIRK
jgi:hypothetical protein